MTEHVDKFGLVKEMYNMKKICLVVFSALTIVLELLPCGTVCIFATSPTERVKETFSYFSLTPFGYANFAPLITATLSIVDDDLREIGIDVKKEYRRKNLASLLVHNLTVAIMEQDKSPFIVLL